MSELAKAIAIINQTFKTGDVVMLNSGGPKMTIAILDGELIQVCWFVRDKLCQAAFTHAELRLVE